MVVIEPAITKDEEGDVMTGREASDGFETASEGTDGGSDNEEQQQKQEKQNVSPPKDDSYEDASNNDELEQVPARF